MLILSRKPLETIMIGNDVAITILETRGGQVRIGIDAPKEISVHRKEVYDKILREGPRLSKAAKVKKGGSI